MELTIGILEDRLRKFPKGTILHVGCNCCNHSASGHESIIGITDHTDQIYRYIELNLNNSSKSEVKLSSDKEQFYIKEVEKLNKIIKDQENKLEDYREYAKSNMKNAEWVLKERSYR